MAARSARGVPGLAVGLAAGGAFLMYAGIKDVPLTRGLRDLFAGNAPEGNAARPSGIPATTWEALPALGAALVAGAGDLLAGQPTGPVPISETVVASGFRVHKSIAPNVNRMVAAAAADGITLRGSGWRDSLQQADLRRRNGCPDLTSPSHTCRVPTAVPGNSQHERGLALDLENAGTKLTRVYGWMAGNAHKYGFKNLPSEPWHWSTTGK